MKMLRQWLLTRFLPLWAKERVLADNDKLRAEIAQLRAKLRELEAYTDGLERGIRAQRRIVINNRPLPGRTHEDKHEEATH